MNKKFFIILLLSGLVSMRILAQYEEGEEESFEEVEIGSSGLDLSPPEEVKAPAEATATESAVEETPVVEESQPPQETPQEVPQEETQEQPTE